MDHDLWIAAKNKALAKIKPRAQAAQRAGKDWIHGVLLQSE
jgi:hypothetical protein